MRSILLLSSLAAIACQSPVFLAADKGGGDGGGMTLKDQLADAQSKLSAAEKFGNDMKTQLDDVKSKLDAETKAKTEFEKQLTEANSKLKAAEDEKKKLAEENATLKSESKRADDKAREQLAAKGLNPGITKDEPGNVSGESIEDLRAKLDGASPDEKFRISAKIRELESKR